MAPSITIIGTGFVGTHFLNAYHALFSTIITTSRTATPHPKSSRHILLDLYASPPPLPATDIAIISVPFSRQLTNPMAYYHGIQHLLCNGPAYPTVIFTSSTSVYPTQNTWVTESSEIDETPRAAALWATEQWLLNTFPRTIILRLGGICGHHRNSRAKRHQSVITAANTPVNLIHIDDIIHIMHQLIRYNGPSDTLNVCCPDHPTKQAYYTYLCDYFNDPHPQFKSDPNARFKYVSNKN
ncbi:MAG: hypothetical protein ACO3K7_03070 [Candidatus Marinamargulisbacteria bacterium]